jgi:UDP-glucose 4-epimerase
MRYALITGGAGFIGSHIARILIHDSHVDKVILLDHLRGYVDPLRRDYGDYYAIRLAGIEDNVTVERGDARNASVVLRLLEAYRPSYIFHLAALPVARPQNLTVEEAREGSVDATATILELIDTLRRQQGYCPRRFVYASSSMVYGDFVEHPATEEHPKRPKEPYGTMKLAGEVATAGLGDYFGVPWTIIRPSAVYGPTDTNRRVSQIFVEKALRGETLNVQGADEALDFTFVQDTANGFVLAATHDAAVGEAFNITHGRASTLLEFAEELRHHVPTLNYKVVERDGARPKRGTLSIAKAQRLIGYQPQYSLKQGIAQYVSFMSRYLLARAA